MWDKGMAAPSPGGRMSAGPIARRVAPLLLGLVCGALAQPAPPRSQEEQRAREVQDFLRLAYALRRTGEFAPAGEAFMQALDRMPRSEIKRSVAAEAVELFRAMGKPEKALYLYRRNHDVEGEVSILIEMGKVDEAVTVARLLKYPPGEAKALAKRGRGDEALQIYQTHGLHRERAELLRDLKRWNEAAAAFAQVDDKWEQAQALDAARSREAKEAFEAAREQILARMKVVLIPQLNEARALFEDKTTDGMTRERARLELARRSANLAEGYERLSRIHLRLGRDKADALAESALKAVRLQVQTLLAEAKGPDGKPLQDQYGKQLVAAQKLPERLAELEKLKAQAQAARPAPPPQKPPGRPPGGG